MFSVIRIFAMKLGCNEVNSMMAQRPWKIQTCCNDLNFDLVVRFWTISPISQEMPWFCSITLKHPKLLCIAILKSIYGFHADGFAATLPHWRLPPMNYGRSQYLRDCFNMHVKDMWLWATRKHGSGHRRFLEGVFLKSSFRGCIMKPEPSHASPSSPFSTSFYINLDPPWEHRLKMVEESIHRTSCSSSQTFPSFGFIRRMRWWSRMNSLRCHPTRQPTFWIFQDHAGDSTWAIHSATGSNVFRCVCWMLFPLDVLWICLGVRRNN